MTHDATLVEATSATTRQSLVAWRIAAMRGYTRSLSEIIHEKITDAKTTSDIDRLATGLLWADIMRLDDREDEAISVFHSFVRPLLPSLNPLQQFVVRDNLSVLQLSESPQDGVTTFYHLVDSRRLALSDASDNRSLLAAYQELECGRPFAALPLLWQALMRSYSTCSWRQSQRVAGQLGRIYLDAGELEQACHFIVVAESSEDIPKLADAIGRQGDPALIESLLTRLKEYANLRRHFAVACTLISSIKDLIPDRDVQAIAEWAFLRCSNEPGRGHCRAMQAAWSVIQCLGHRLQPDLTQTLIHAAINHPVWLASIPSDGRVLIDRELLVRAVTSLVASAPPEILPIIARACLPLATERKQTIDYAVTINLLCHVSVRSGDDCRKEIREALFNGSTPASRILAQAASTLGAEAYSVTDWNSLAEVIANEVRHTVQRSSDGSSFQPVRESIMTITRDTQAGKVQTVTYGSTGLEALATGIRHLSEASVSLVISALLDMIVDADNHCLNKVRFLQALIPFAELAPPYVRDDVIRRIKPIACGSGELQERERGDSPSAPAMNFGLGSPEEVQSMALITSAVFCCGSPSEAIFITEVLTDCFTNPHMEVRRGAYAAARHLPNLSGEQLLPILMGLRDPSPEASIVAFAAFADRKEWILTRPMWKMFLLAVRLASQSLDSSVRRHAAIALRSRQSDAPTALLRSDCSDLINVFLVDLSWMVRQAARGV